MLMFNTQAYNKVAGTVTQWLAMMSHTSAVGAVSRLPVLCGTLPMPCATVQDAQ